METKGKTRCLCKKSWAEGHGAGREGGNRDGKDRGGRASLSGHEQRIPKQQNQTREVETVPVGHVERCSRATWRHETSAGGSCPLEDGDLGRLRAGGGPGDGQI